MTEANTSRGVLFIVSAPSGAGKTSLVQALLEAMAGIGVSISHTTRAMRPGEQDGKDYHFVDVPTFKQMVEQDAFLEHAQVFDNFYGTSKAAVIAQLEAGEDVILEIDWQGAQQVRKHFADAVGIFILPPSTAALRQRLTSRGQDDESIIDLRMSEAESEMSHYAEFDYVVVNDDFEVAVGELKAIVTAQRLHIGRQRSMLEGLISDLLA